MTDATKLIRVIQEVRSDEIFNLAVMSHVHVSFDTPEYAGNTDGAGHGDSWRQSRCLTSGHISALYSLAHAERLRGCEH